MSVAQDTYCLGVSAFITLYDPTTPKDILRIFSVAFRCLDHLNKGKLDTFLRSP
jgi:hypothetical protein